MLRVAVVALLCTVACGKSGASAGVADARRRQAERVACDAGLPRDVQVVLGLAAEAAVHSFTVVYRSADGSGRTTLAQDPPRRRVEVVNGDTTQLTLVRSAGSYACLRETGRWRCQQTGRVSDDAGAFSATAMQRTIDSLSDARATYDFRTERRRVAGTSARCLVTRLKPGSPPDPSRAPVGELCVAPDGAPLVLTSGTSSLTAISYQRGTERGAFDLPAKPTGTSAP